MDSFVDALIYILAFNLGIGLLAFFGAFRGVGTRRRTNITSRECLKVFVLGWLAGSAIVVLARIVAFALGFAFQGILETLLSLVVLFFIMRKLIVRYERKAGYDTAPTVNSV